MSDKREKGRIFSIFFSFDVSFVLFYFFRICLFALCKCIRYIYASNKYFIIVCGNILWFLYEVREHVNLSLIRIFLYSNHKTNRYFSKLLKKNIPFINKPRLYSIDTRLVIREKKTYDNHMFKVIQRRSGHRLAILTLKV